MSRKGQGDAMFGGVRTAINAGYAVVAPAAANHSIVNTGTEPLKLYTIYSPPNHRDSLIHHARANADTYTKHFGGRTSQ